MTKQYLAVLLLVLFLCLVVTPEVFAGPGEGGKLPYESWVRQK